MTSQIMLKADEYFRDQCARLGEEQPVIDPYTTFIKLRGITQQEFVNMLGVGVERTNIRSWARGTRMRPATLARLGEVMGIERPARLLDRAEWPRINAELRGETKAETASLSLKTIGHDRVAVKIEGTFPRHVALQLLRLSSNLTSEI